MWYILEKIQRSYTLSERLLRAICDLNFSSYTENVEDLIDQGADVNRLHGSLLPLHCACMVSDLNSLRILLEKGAEVNAYDGFHRTALHHAAERSASCVDLLIQCGGYPDAIDANRNTPLHWAAYKNNAECVKTLLQHNAHIDARDFNDETALNRAALKGSLESMKVLLDYNANVYLANYNGVLPILRASVILARGLNTHKDDICVMLLIKALGQFDLRTVDGELPEEINRDPKLRKLFLSYCTNPRPLQQLCRYAIRKSLGKCYLPNAVKTLPIPEKVQGYLLLECEL